MAVGRGADVGSRPKYVVRISKHKRLLLAEAAEASPMSGPSTGWRFAHSHYQSKTPSRLTDLALLTWALFFALVYGAASQAGWWSNVPEVMVGGIFIGVPMAVGILHRRILLETLKEPDALYRKRIEVTR